MTITTTEKGKAAKRPQPASAGESVGSKSTKDSISVLPKPPEAITDADNAQVPAPSQTTTVTRPKRVPIQETATAKSTEDWSEAEEEGDAAFARSSIVARTPPQTCCTPTDVMMAPKKKEPTLAPNHLSTKATSTVQLGKQSSEVSSEAPPTENASVIDMLRKVQTTLSLPIIRSNQKLDAQRTMGAVIDLVTAMSEKLRECHEQHGKQCCEQHGKQPLTEDDARLVNIEKQLAKLTKAIMEPPQTYAQAVQRNAAKPTNSNRNQPIGSEPGIKNRKEKLRMERAKAEVLLTIRDSDDVTKNKLTNMSEEVITNTLEQAIAAAGREPVQIRRVQKTANHGVKIRCATDKEADELRGMDWEKVFEGAKIAETLYGVVVHGVSKYVVDFEKDKSEEIIVQIRDANSEEMTVEKVMPLRKRTRNPNASTQSIVVFYKCPKKADECIQTGINIGHHHYAIAERYIPQCQIKQCFKCQAYGHKASICTRKARCGKCAQEHETKGCQSATTQCANCEGSHHAWSHECPVRQHKKEEAEILKSELSVHYTS
jgi:hypothetical protein